MDQMKNREADASVESIVIPSVQTLLDSGIELVVSDRDAIDGWYPLNILSSKELIEYLRYPEKWIAEARGVKVEAYIEWKRTRGNVPCCARTKRGRQCRRTATGGHGIFDPKEFEKLLNCGLLCASHS